MWLLALAALAALAPAANAECLSSLEPYDKTILRLESSGTPFTWRGAAVGCQKIAPGFGLLGRDFLCMSATDRKQCGERPVPLGLRRTPKGRIVWGTACPHCFEVKEAVNDTVLSLRLTENSTTPALHQLGSLDPTTNQWRLVASNATYTCALCQRAWVSWLGRFNETVPDRPQPYLSAYSFRIVQDGDVGVAEAIDQALGRFNKSAKALHVEVVGSQGKGTLVRVKSSASMMALRSVVEAFSSSSFAVVDWQDTSWCPAERFDGFEWPGVLVESTREMSLPDFQVVSRRCVAATRPDGDYDAVWEDAVDFWIDHGAECKSQPALQASRELQRFVSQPPSTRSAALKTFSKVTALIPKLRWAVENAQTFYPPRRTFSLELFGALEALLTETKQEADGPADYCTADECVLVTGDLQVGNDLYALAIRDHGAPEVLRRPVDGDQPLPAVTLRLPSKLLTSGSVALHAFLARNVKEAPLFKPIHNLVVKASTAVVVLAASSVPLAAWRAERAWPVVFAVDNRRSRHTFERYFAVWTMGDSEETTLPCQLTKIDGAVDTFVCRSFQSDAKNFAVGRFLVYHGIFSPDTDFVRYAEPMVRGYVGVPIDETALQVVADFTDRLVDDEQTLKRRELTSSTAIIGKVREYLPEILHGVVLAGPAVTASRRHVKVLVSDLSGVDPVVGVSVDKGAAIGDGSVQTVTAAARNVSTDSAIDVVLGVDADPSFHRLHVLAITNTSSFYADTGLERFIAKKLMVVNVEVLSKAALDETMRNLLYLEIRVDGRDSNGGLQVATWSKADGDWSVSSCKRRRSSHGEKHVFRCDRLAVADNALAGRYLVFEPHGFADALGTPLLAVLIAAGILSIVSLAAIAGTAIALPGWRQDLGHKILLQMASALSLNLALGFTSSLVSVDTASVACIAVGALRHFSYLAMFAWMLVLSSLQLRRLLSVLPRNTPNLLLKVFCCAWGLPAAFVAGLVAFHRKMYRSVVADRGFCYPEGVDFAWSLQAPAATVLVLNAAIFVVILARLYGCCGWGDTAILQRHMNERNFQVRRLRAVFFTFCLFGIAWVFHLLFEQGVFREKIVYEYLFLMTASVHVFLLSCMFVFFDPNTRKEWGKVSPLSSAAVTTTPLRELSS